MRGFSAVRRFKERALAVILSLKHDGFGEAGRAYGSTSHDWWAALVGEEEWDWRQVLLPPNLMIF